MLESQVMKSLVPLTLVFGTVNSGEGSHYVRNLELPCWMEAPVSHRRDAWSSPQQFQIPHYAMWGVFPWMTPAPGVLHLRSWMTPALGIMHLHGMPFPQWELSNWTQPTLKITDTIMDCFKLLNLGMVCYAEDNKKYILSKQYK